MSAPRRRVDLTLRGVWLLVAGALLSVAGILLGVRLLTQVGVLLLVAVGAGVGVLLLEARAAERGGVRLVRRVVPHPVTAGGSAVVEVELTAAGGLYRLDRMDVSERAARELSGAAGLRARVHRSRSSLRLTYRVEPERRGRWTVGPLQVLRHDVFGVARWHGPLGETMRVAVRPRTTDLVMDTRAASPDVDRSAGGTRMPAPDDASLRDYRTGDDLRRVHWRSSARRGELVVRQDERAARRPVSVLLDVPEGDDDAEWSIAAAASVALALLRSGHRVRLVGGDVVGAATDHHRPDVDDQSAAALLDQTVDLTRPATRVERDAWLRTAVDTLSQQSGGAELVFAVVGGLDPEALAALARLGDANLGWAFVRLGGHRSPRSDADDERTLAALRSAGWRVVGVAPGGDLVDAWQRLMTSAHGDRHAAVAR